MSDMENKKVIEINGVKLEVDMRYARRIDSFRVGDSVKVLMKKDPNYSSSKDEVLPGMIVDFANFKELPTLVIATYKEGSWCSSPTIDFLYYNENSADKFDIVYCDENELRVSEQSILQKFDHDIAAKQRELDDIISKKEYFITHFVPVEKAAIRDKED